MMRPPPRLAPGATIGVFAPSARSATCFPERFERGLTALRRCFDVDVRLPTLLERRDGTLAGTPQERVAAFLELLADPSVGAIFTTLGGANSNDLLPLLPRATLRAHPKIVIGYSDTTALLLGYTAATGVMTFFGPAVMPQMGEYPEPHPYTLSELRRVLVEGGGGRLPLNVDEISEARDWSLPPERRQRRPATRPAVWRPGAARGVLFGGNLSTLNFIVGTPFLGLPPSDLVFFFECVAHEARPAMVRRALTHLRAAGVFEHVRAVLVGRSPDTGPPEVLRDIVLESFEDTAIAVAGELPFGHVDPMTTLPIGAVVTVDCGASGVDVCVEGPTVTR